MIKTDAKPEPANFNLNVRQPGLAFLRDNPNAKPAKFWNKAREELYAAYNGICAYTAMFFIGPATVDHFAPSSTNRQLAYEWSNYRLACALANSYKGNNEGIIDPFFMEDGWFAIDFPSCLVRPGQNLEHELEQRIWYTIKILRLNSAEQLVQERCNIAIDFVDGQLSFDFISRRYPFLAAEINRFGGREVLATVFKRKGT